MRGHLSTINAIKSKITQAKPQKLLQKVAQLGKEKFKNKPAEFIGPQNGVHVHVYPSSKTSAVGHLKSPKQGEIEVRNLDSANEALKFLNEFLSNTKDYLEKKEDASKMETQLTEWRDEFFAKEDVDPDLKPDFDSIEEFRKTLK